MIGSHVGWLRIFGFSPEMSFLVDEKLTTREKALHNSDSEQ
jgi:hypothetical protein